MLFKSGIEQRELRFIVAHVHLDKLHAAVCTAIAICQFSRTETRLERLVKLSAFLDVQVAVEDVCAGMEEVGDCCGADAVGAT